VDDQAIEAAVFALGAFPQLLEQCARQANRKSVYLTHVARSKAVRFGITINLIVRFCQATLSEEGVVRPRFRIPFAFNPILARIGSTGRLSSVPDS
jgi:hypothetical protein